MYDVYAPMNHLMPANTKCQFKGKKQWEKKKDTWKYHSAGAKAVMLYEGAFVILSLLIDRRQTKKSNNMKKYKNGGQSIHQKKIQERS